MDSVFLMDMSHSDDLFLLMYILVVCVFQGTGPSNLGCQICGHKVVCRIPLFSF